MDVNKMMQQVQQMQAEMAKAQEELAQSKLGGAVGGLKGLGLPGL